MKRRRFKNKEVKSPLKVVSVKCTDCNGVGMVPVSDTTAITCETCKGEGYIDK